MNELYALEAGIRAEIDRLIRDWSAPLEADGYTGISSISRRLKIFRFMFSEERAFTIDEPPVPSFMELWEVA